MSAQHEPDPALADHHIAAQTSLPERHPTTLKHGDTFAVFDPRGDLVEEPDGLYHRDTRILSRLTLAIEGRRPLLLSAATLPDNTAFSAEMTNPDLERDAASGLRRESIHLRRLKLVHDGALHERIAVRNYADRPQRVRLTVRFQADFADLFEVRGERRPQRGRLLPGVVRTESVELGYVGLDGVEVRTSVSFDPPPEVLQSAHATYSFTLQPNESRRIFVRAGVSAPGAPWNGRAVLGALRAARLALRGAQGRAAAFDTSHAGLREALRRSMADLRMLVTDTPVGAYPYAGTPWFSAPFGRDGVLTALMMLWIDPAIARGVLRFLAATQADAFDAARDAEPGKILHEMRQGEMARLREVPFGRYYGSVDATPLFVLLLGAYVRRTADLALARELWPATQRALAWMDGPGDPDRDGFVEYARASGDGLANQGWKDSQDAVFHADGTPVRGPVALCEVQGYVYGARLAAADLAGLLGDAESAAASAAAAAALRRRFEAAFWCEELGVYALALDGDKRPCRVVTSNAGQALLAGLPGAARAASVARTLLDARSCSGWGIRTLSASASRYNPMSYHNGSVWPHDNALVALGFARYGLKAEALAVFEALFDAATHMALLRLPELYCGFGRRRGVAPTLYPVACSPQAWSCASLPALVQAALGVEIDGFANEIRFHKPALPAFLDDFSIAGLRVPAGAVDIAVERRRGRAEVRVTRREGEARVTVNR
jgi:glycogen debranching enzyme